MRRVVLGLTILITIALSAKAQKPIEFIEKLSKEKEVININIGGFFLNTVKPIITYYAKETTPLINGVKKIQLVAAKNYNSTTATDYSAMINDLKDVSDYETLVQVKDGADYVRIMMKVSNDKVKDLYVFCCDKTDVVAIRLQGNIKNKDIEKMIHKYNKKH